MQAKGMIKVFLVLLALVCIFPIFYTVTSRSYEKKADNYALSKLKGYNENTATIEVKDSVNYLKSQYKRAFLDSLSGKDVSGGAGITLSKAMERQLSLGLDLKGGMSVVMAIEQDDVLKQLSNNSKDPQFNNALAKANERQKSDSRPYLDIFKDEFERINANSKLASLFMNQKFDGKINFGMSNSQVVEVLRKEVDASVGNTFNVVKARIDQFGVVQPNVNLEKSTGRIILELPGVDDPKRVESILQTTAELGFWRTYENRVIGNILFNRGNEVLRDIKTLEKNKIAKTDTNIVNAAVEPTSSLSALAGGKSDSTKIDTTKANTAKADKVDSTFNPLFEVLSPNVTEMEGGGKGQMWGQGSLVGYARQADMSKVDALLAYDQVKALLPQDCKLFWTAQSISDKDKIYGLHAIRDKGNLKAAPLSGDAIVDATPSFDQSGNPIVSLKMDATGAEKWKMMTAEASSHKGDIEDPKEQIAIVLDNRVFSAPVVNGEIAGGESQITMGSAKNGIQESQDLANILKAGKLDAKTRIIEKSVVGPTLGKEASSKGIMSFLIALVIVCIVMLLYYNTAGIVADISLVVNLFFIICAIIGFGTALTLPGLAGIILTIGMAVDASIIIFERIREELAKGKSLALAVSDGFTKSYSAIIDANVTNFYTALILYLFGKGPIKGFGAILMIGILSSMITGVILSRIILEDFFIARGKNVKFDTGFSKGLFKNFNFDFIGKSKMFIIGSVIVIVIGSISALTRGFDLGVDFQGGRKYVIKFDKEVALTDISKDMAASLGGAPIVKTFGTTGDRVQVTTSELVNEDNAVADAKVLEKVYEAAKKHYKVAPDLKTFNSTKYVESTSKIGATIAEDIKSSSIYTALIAIIGIFIYIVIRFRKWQFGAGVVVSLIHDVAFTLGIFSLFKGILPFSLEVDQTIIAAVLTLIGYSMNDTVVVFDRIRENLREGKHATLKELFDHAMNSTLSRTIMTSFYTFTTMVIIFIFGGESVRGFSFAMILGILVGTYSSIFIAAPVAYHLLKGNLEEARK
jgi:SecD/SecF fusion protein